MPLHDPNFKAELFLVRVIDKSLVYHAFATERL